MLGGLRNLMDYSLPGSSSYQVKNKTYYQQRYPMFSLKLF